MTPAAAQILEAAMALSDEERAELAARLNDSLQGLDTPEIAEAWRHEIARRLKEIDDGTVEMIPAEEVHRQLKERFGFGILDES